MKTLLCASTGKDSIWALHTLRGEGHDVPVMLITMGTVSGRVPFQRASRELVDAQAAALDIHDIVVELPNPCSGVQYESAINLATAEAVRDFEIKSVAFADVTGDFRQYREKLFAQMNLAVQFPMWERDTAEMAQNMINGGVKAIISAVDLDKLDRSFIGREFDAALLADLPAGVNPSGQLGGFRTFCYDGPDFKHPIAVKVGQVHYLDGHAIAELTLG